MSVSIIVVYIFVVIDVHMSAGVDNLHHSVRIKYSYIHFSLFSMNVADVLPWGHNFLPGIHLKVFKKIKKRTELRENTHRSVTPWFQTYTYLCKVDSWGIYTPRLYQHRVPLLERGKFTAHSMGRDSSGARSPISLRPRIPSLLDDHERRRVFILLKEWKGGLIGGCSYFWQSKPERSKWRWSPPRWGCYGDI